MKIGYGHWEHTPIRYTDTEAWVFNERWGKLHAAEANVNGVVLTKQEFEKNWPNLPPLPSQAFREKQLDEG